LGARPRIPHRAANPNRWVPDNSVDVPTLGLSFLLRFLTDEQAAVALTCYVALGAAIAIGSLALAPLPGPGWGTFFVGLGIVAGEVWHVARLLDRGEVKLRRALQRTKGVWDTSAPVTRVLIALTITLGVMASVYGAYHVFSVASFVR
jgi:hypothetical protein